MTGLGGESRVPLVVRVKRAADEEPLDILRLRPLPSKLARGDQGAFELHSLQFRHAGTIAASEPVAASTVNLIKNVPSSLHKELPAGMLQEPVRTLSMEEQFDILREFRRSADEGSSSQSGIKKEQHMFVVTRKFRPVAVDALGSLAQQIGRSTLDAGGDVVVEDNGQVAADTDDVEMSYAVCDLETVGLQSEKRSKRARMEADGRLPNRQQLSGITCNDEEMVLETTDNLDSVYDIYVLHHQPDIDGSRFCQDINSFLSDTDLILGYNSDNVLWSDAAESARVLQEELADEEDSNDEDNWRNDYPDETSEESSEGESGSGEEEDDHGYIGQDHDYFGHRPHRRRRLEEDDSDEKNSAEEEDEDGL